MIERQIKVAQRVRSALAKGRPVKRAKFQDIELRIDRPAGYVQQGKDAAGNKWERTFKVDYGYIPGTAGGDGDGVDVYLGPASNAPLAYWVIQRTAAGGFDEYKLMLGFLDRRSAKAMWEAHTPAKFYGGMTTTSMGVVKALLGVEPVAIHKARTDLMVALTKSEDRSTASLLLEAGPPMEWSGSVAQILGEVRRKKIEELWSALSAEQKAMVEQAWNAYMDTLYEEDEPTPAPVRERMEQVAADLVAKYPELAKRDGLLSVEKASEEQRYVLGVVLTPDEVDAQGDTYDAPTVERAAHLYLAKFRNRGLQHQQLVNHYVDLVESYIAPCDITFGSRTVKAGTWLAAFVVHDDEIWQAVKRGELGGLSIGGVATKVDPATGEVIAPPPDMARLL